MGDLIEVALRSKRGLLIGWARHLRPRTSETALCGLRPRFGWTEQAKQLGMCELCAKKEATRHG